MKAIVKQKVIASMLVSIVVDTLERVCFKGKHCPYIGETVYKQLKEIPEGNQSNSMSEE